MKKAILFVLILTIAASFSFAANKSGVGVIGLPATSILGINPTAVPVYKMNLDNGAQFGIGGTMASFDSDNSRTDIVAYYTVLNKLHPGLVWKIGGGVDIISGKAGGFSGNGTAIAMIVGVEQTINDNFSVELIGYPIVVLSSSIDGTNYNGNIIGGASVGVTYWM